VNTLRYHELVGKTVVAADGQRLGRVADLTAARRGNGLVVTALLVGPAAFVQRVGLRWLRRRGGPPPYRVPWPVVARIDDRVHLSVPLAQLDAWRDAASEPDVAEDR